AGPCGLPRGVQLVYPRLARVRPAPRVPARQRDLRRKRRLGFVRLRRACAALAASGLLICPARGADTAEPGFAVTTYAGGLNWPVAMAFASDGRLFVGEKAGVVYILENGA